MGSLNRAIICGRLGRDPALSYSQSGTAFVSLSVATDESFITRDGNRQAKTEWHRVTAFNKLAENCSRYLRKGSQVLLEGKLQTRSYQKDGVTHYSTEIIATNVQFLTSRQEQQQQQSWEQSWDQPWEQGWEQPQSQAQAQAQAQAQQQSWEQPQAQQEWDDQKVDNVPF